MAARNQPQLALTIATAALACSAACGPKLDPATARAQFSSKSLSRPGMVAPSDASEVRPVEPAKVDPPVPAETEAAPAPAVAVKPREEPVAATPAASPAPESARADTPQPSPATTLEATPDRSSERVRRAAAAGQWAALRAHAIEASIRNPRLLRELAPAALRDENRGVRFVACMAVAEARIEGLSESITPLLADQSASVRAAAMLALARGGEPVNFSPLAAMLADNDPEVRANAYLVLGELGNESAIPMIRESLGRGMKRVNPIRVRLVDLAAAEALVKLGDENEVEPIRAALFAPPEQAELTVVACDAVRRLRDEVARPMLERLILAGGNGVRSPEIRLAAARALAVLGDGRISMAVATQFLAHPDARIRAQVAALLGELKSPEAAGMLAGLLADQNPTVQIAAAGGIEAQP